MNGAGDGAGGRVHRVPIKVRFYELDPYGHLNHSAFVQYFEVGRVELLEEVGLGLDELHERGYHFVVNRIETHFLAPVMPGDTVVVETGVIEMRRASSRWAQRMVRGDEEVARQELRAAVTDVEGRPVRVPPEIVERLRPYLRA
ncbi:MAG: acyl-CoA thioesterase [Actinomyces sp.]|nr:MAG: acyl-CoA thioesterase [Actinomyces sp.]